MAKAAGESRSGLPFSVISGGAVTVKRARLTSLGVSRVIPWAMEVRGIEATAPVSRTQTARKNSVVCDFISDSWFASRGCRAGTTYALNSNCRRVNPNGMKLGATRGNP